MALTSALNELAPNFEQATGNKLNIGYSLIADIRKRMLDGETADVIILSRPVMDELDKQQKFASGSITNVAGTPVAVAIRAGGPAAGGQRADRPREPPPARALSVVAAREPESGGLRPGSRGASRRDRDRPGSARQKLSLIAGAPLRASTGVPLGAGG